MPPCAPFSAWALCSSMKCPCPKTTQLTKAAPAPSADFNGAQTMLAINVNWREESLVYPCNSWSKIKRPSLQNRGHSGLASGIQYQASRIQPIRLDNRGKKGMVL